MNEFLRGDMAAAERAERAPIQVDVGKLAVLLMILVSATVLAIVHVVDGSVVAALYTAMMAYLFGNGVVAMKGRRPQGVVSAAPELHLVEKADRNGELLEQIADAVVPDREA